jgi:hypothetical protein
MEVLEIKEKVKSSHNGTCFADMAPDRDEIKPTRAVITKCIAVNVVAANYNRDQSVEIKSNQLPNLTSTEREEPKRSAL